ncbi:MAG TPA: hypothetical protein VKB68_10365 [Stellaceae bacterium]|nr:hypothetical protein [Stellaceae bacterium]
MTGVSIELLHAWHDFYVFMGTAAATLIGAMFVVASIGGGFLTRDRSPEIRAFLTPTVVHLATILLGSALMLAPGLEAPSLLMPIGIGALAGLAYSGLVAARLLRRKIERIDRVWYAAVPFVGYGVMLAAVVLIFESAPASLDTLAIAAAILLLAGVRNAWDLILFFLAQPRGSN